MKTLEEVIQILTSHRLSPIHDYDRRVTFIGKLGVYKGHLEQIMEEIGSGWFYLERRRGESDGEDYFGRFDILQGGRELPCRQCSDWNNPGCNLSTQGGGYSRCSVYQEWEGKNLQ